MAKNTGRGSRSSMMGTDYHKYLKEKVDGGYFDTPRRKIDWGGVFFGLLMCCFVGVWLLFIVKGLTR